MNWLERWLIKKLGVDPNDSPKMSYGAEMSYEIRDINGNIRIKGYHKPDFWGNDHYIQVDGKGRKMTETFFQLDGETVETIRWDPKTGKKISHIKERKEGE